MPATAAPPSVQIQWAAAQPGPPGNWKQKEAVAPIFHHTPFTHPKASSSFGSHGVKESSHWITPWRAGCCVLSSASLGVPLCSAGHTQGLNSQQTPEEWQKCCSQPSCGLTGCCMVAKRDGHTSTYSFTPAGKNKPARVAGIATSMLGTDMSHRAGPGLGAAPTAPSTADTTVVMQLGEYWDCGGREARKDCW